MSAHDVWVVTPVYQDGYTGAPFAAYSDIEAIRQEFSRCPEPEAGMCSFTVTSWAEPGDVVTMKVQRVQLHNVRPMARQRRLP